VLVSAFVIIGVGVARMMWFGCQCMGDGAGKPVVPCKDVYIHALVRDERGAKMSKSVGNVIDPLELVDEYGADAVRFTLSAMAAMGQDIRLSVSRVAGYRNFGTKLWNAARFGEMNGCVPVEGFDPAAVSQPLNRWIVGETGRLRAAVDEALEAYRFDAAAAALYADVWGVFCDWYVELSKPLLTGEDAAAKAETQATLAWALDARLKLLHPFMPFITESLWEQIAKRPAMLAVTDWPEVGPEAGDAAADAEIGRVIGAIEAIRSVRAEMNVPPGARLPLILTDGSDAFEAALREALPLIERLARVEGLSRADAPAGAVAVPFAEGAAALPLAGVVDGAKEKARLEKALAKVEKEAAGIARKLDNPGFLAKAPEEVVEENRERLAAAQAEAERLRSAAARAAALV